MGGGIPKGETYNNYGDPARTVGIDSIEEHGTFVTVGISEIPEICAGIEGIFFYKIKHKQEK